MENKENALKYMKHRILTHYDSAKKILNGEMPFPRMLIFHPTYICNHNCIGCDFKDLNSKLKAILTPEESDRILDEMIKNGIQAVEFGGGGEPLLAPNIIQMIEKLKKNNIAMGLLTNGSKLKGDIAEAVVKNLVYVRVSLESGSKEVFKKVKNVDDDNEFENITNNLREAVNLKKKLNSKINISLKFTVGKNNYMDMENAINLAIELGVDSIQFKLYENVDSVQLYNPKERYMKESRGVAAKLDELKEIYSKEILILGDLKKTKIECKCWLSPLITVIDALGEVYLCSYYRHRLDTHCIGNVLKKDFKDIWLSERHKKAIENINIEECNIYDCRFHFYNEMMKSLIIDDKDALKFI